MAEADVCLGGLGCVAGRVQPWAVRGAGPGTRRRFCLPPGSAILEYADRPYPQAGDGVRSGPARLSWLDYERDIREDFRQVFGEEPGRLLPVALMSDGDNTGSQFRA